MSRYIEVVGDDDDVEGDVMGYEELDGDVMGHGGMQVVGYDGYGQPIVVGKAATKRRVAVPIRKPGWRRTQLAPGVIAPDQGLLPLPLNGLAGNTFTLAQQAITFQGQIQKPFRGERLLVSTVRTGASAVGRLLGQVFVGTDLQQLDVGGFDLEQVGGPTAFGVRLTMKPAQPGVFIRIITTLSNALAGADTITTTITLLGRNVH